MSLKLANAFSLSMIERQVATVAVTRLTADAACTLVREAADVESYVGHENIAAVIAADLDIQVEVNRVAFRLEAGDILLVAQYVGPRLPEGATELPEGARIEYRCVRYAWTAEQWMARYRPSLDELERWRKMSPAELRAEADRREAAEQEEIAREAAISGREHHSQWGRQEWPSMGM